MIYAVQLHPQIAIWCSEAGRPAPRGFRRVTRASFRRVWRLRDGCRAFGLWPTNPYEAAR